MIVVKLELWPLGNEEQAEEIGRMYVVNNGNGDTQRGDYDGHVCRRGTRERPPDGTFTRTGEVTDYPRQSYNVWRLIVRMLKSCFPEEDSDE